MVSHSNCIISITSTLLDLYLQNALLRALLLEVDGADEVEGWEYLALHHSQELQSSRVICNESPCSSTVLMVFLQRDINRT